MTTFPQRTFIGAFLAICAAAGWVDAQEENERLGSGIPLENSIVNRDTAFRWRWEVQDSEDNHDLLSEDPALASYPQQLYTTEMKMFRVNGASAFGMYDLWQNDQDLDVFRASGGFGFPAGESWRIDLKGTYLDRETIPDTQYYYFSAGRPLGQFYTYSQYRYSSDGRDINNGISQGHQLSEYLSWNPIKTFRLGGQVAYCIKENGDDAAYGRIFTAASFFDYSTTVRLEVFDYESLLYTDYREYKAYLYQKLSSSSLIRLQYRYYNDSESRESHGPGVKLMHFFSSRVEGHIGYVRYSQSEGTDFDSFLAGMSLVF
jgi:hypothetical protein